MLSSLLRKHYGREVIVLIDEYDVPLSKAHENGYYDQMAMLIRNMFDQVLKTNDNLKFAVLTGCLRITTGSIFTGLNNMKVLSVTDVRFDEYFGFTDSEVRALLEYYDLSDHYDTIKEWYDGYRFGNVDVYCPWDVLCYCDILVETDDGETGMVIEIKYAEDGNLTAACEKALPQIESKNYAEKLREDGMEKILKYGIACYKKRCRIVMTEEMAV